MYYCWLSMTPLKTGQRSTFMKNGFQIRIQHPRISFGANFQNFLTILRFSWKLRPTFWGAGPRPKQHVPPVSHLLCWEVQISGDPILSLGCISIPREKFIPYPPHVQSGGVLFQKKYPPLYRRCVWKTYTDSVYGKRIPTKGYGDRRVGSEIKIQNSLILTN